MNASVAVLLDRFPHLAVLVIGESMLDRYLVGVSDRLCREAPVPIVSVRRRTDAPGGAANTAVNARALGARVSFLSVAGADGEGETLRQLLANRGVNVDDLVLDPGRRTLTKQRILGGSQLLVRFDEGSTEPVDGFVGRRLLAALERLHARHDVIVVSDYGYGILTSPMVERLGALQARAPRVLVVDSKTLGRYRGAGVTAVKPNFSEALQLLAEPGRRGHDDRLAFVAAEGHRLLDVVGAQIVAVTLDTEGALFFERGRPAYRTYARPADHTRAAGAGDTFATALGLALAAGGDLGAAAELASAASAVVVQKDGTAACSGAELRTALAGSDKRCADLDTLAARVQRYREEGRRVVFTNGCFDLLHPGHIAYLNAAKAQGDILVVAVNSDPSVRRLKGPERPINALDDRLQVLAALSSVDHVIAFDDDTPVELVRALRPDVYVKGGDYSRDMLPEAPVVHALGGVVRIVPYVEERSTTSIIERIRSTARPDGATARSAV